MTRSQRASFVASVSILLGAIACGAPSDPSPTGSTSDPLGLTRQDAGATPITSETGASCPNVVEACLWTNLPVPAALAGTGCTEGIAEGPPDGPTYFYACPIGTPLPGLQARLGFTAPWSSSTTHCDSCVGAPLPGWTLFIDDEGKESPSGCRGVCPQ